MRTKFILTAVLLALIAGVLRGDDGAKDQTSPAASSAPKSGDSPLINVKGHVWARAVPIEKPAWAAWEADSAEILVLTALNAPIELDFVSTKLSDVIDELQIKLGVQIVLDTSEKNEIALKELNDKEITFKIKDVSARSALSLLLEPQDLDWTVRDEVIFIAPIAKIHGMLSTKVYNVTDPLESADDPSQFLQTVTATVAPNSWTGSGGVGSLSVFDAPGDAKLLIVSQNRRGHEAVSKFLVDLRAAAKIGDKANAPVENESLAGQNPKDRNSRPAMKQPPADTSSDGTLRSSLNNFGFDLLRTTYSDGSNTVVSPCCVYPVLAMTLAGARGATADELAKVLKVDDREKLPEKYAALRESLLAQVHGDELQIKLANRLWISKGVSLAPAFQQLLAKRYDTDAQIEDFTGNLDQAKRDIAGWVSKATDDRIEGMELGANRDTVAALSSVLYFNGKWVKPFDPALTQKRAFHNFDGKKTAPVMIQEDHCLYAAVDGVQIAEKDYKEGTIAMTLILPKKASRRFGRSSIRSATPN